MKVLIETIRESRILILGISTTMIALLSYVIFLYPGDEQALTLFKAVENMEIAKAFFLTKYGNGAPFRFWMLNQCLILLPYILVALSMFMGASIFSSEQDNNRLDVLMSLPLSRTRIYLEKIGAIALIALMVDVVGFLFTWIGIVLVNQVFPIENMILVFLFLLPLELAFGSLSALLAIIFMDQFKARVTILVVFVTSIFLLFFANLSQTIEPLGYLSLFKYYDPVTLTMEKFQRFNKWGDPVILFIITIMILFFTIYILENKDLIPTYNRDVKTVKGKIRGIPFFFFYIRWLKNKFPILVEQIQADRLVLNFFLLYAFGISCVQIFMFTSIDQAKAIISVSDNILYAAIIQGRNLEPSLASFTLIEGYGLFIILVGIFSVIMGPRLFTRDLLGQTSDILLSTSVTRERFIFERILAFTIEIIEITLVMIVGASIGTIYRDSLDLLPFLIVAIISAQMFFWMVGIVGLFLAVINKKTYITFSLYAGIYFGLLMMYLILGINKSTIPLLKLFPFTLYDPYRIIIEKTIDLFTIGAICISALLGFVALLIVRKRVLRIELVETYEEKQSNNRMSLKN